MNKIMMILIVVFSIKAQTTPMPIYISATAEDNVGSRLVYNIKENINRSTSMKLVSTKEESFIQVHIVTMDPSANENGYSIIYSFVLTWGETQKFYNHYVGTCGTQVVNEVSEFLVAYIYKASE